MIHVTDEMLMAFTDGELGIAEAAAVEEAIERDQEVRQKVERFRALQTQLHTAFHGLDLGEPSPQLQKLLENTAPDNIVPLGRHQTKKSWVHTALPYGTMIAACLAVVAIISVINISGPPNWVKPVDDGVALAGTVNKIAMNTLSGTKQIADGIAVTPILSFVAGDGRKCRELTVRSDELAARLIVCRASDDDDWCFEAFSRTPDHETPSQSYEAAGTSRDAVIEAAYARLKVQRELSLDDERQAIEREWK